MKNQEPTKPTGNLEELFRHHLAEAAVPPAPRVWEQVDNSLLLAENQTYRRRLRTARWVAAASLLLATLTGTGWWEHRDFRPTEVASTTSPISHPASLARKPVPTVPLQPGASALNPGSLTPRGVGAKPASQAASAPLAAGQMTDQPELALRSVQATGQARRLLSNQPANRARLVAGHAALLSTSKPVAPGGFARRSAAIDRQLLASQRAAAVSGVTADAALPEPDDASANLRNSGLGSAADQLEAAVASQLALLASAPVGLAQASVLPLPRPLPPLSVPNPTAPPSARRWRLGVGYAAGVFQANVDFARGADAFQTYNPALGDNSPALSEAAAAEYRIQQRPGRSQRLRLQASRRLRGHWSLETGLDVAQQESRSATSYIFTGEQVPDLSQPLQGGPRRTTSARYRTAGLPLELRYANSVKTGFSLYGRVGAIVSALLTVRTEVANNPEATRTYNLLAASTPYRRVLGTARGAVGVQFRPASHDYSLSLGPVAEGGLWSLNAHPAQGFFSQSRPYSVGLEAMVEFGRSAKPSKSE